MNKSIKLNMFLNALKNLFAIIFPLITFPYASQILKVENMGKISFSNSIVGYFVLLAGLGISSYAIRQGSKYKNTSELAKFASEVFSINILSTIIAYLLLALLIVVSPKINNYKYFILIQSLTILFTTLGTDWINSILEDFFYITVTTIIFQFISLILLFLLVKDINDYYIYACIMMLSSVGYNVISFFHVRKHVKIKFTLSLNLNQHLKPILIIFSTAIATTIYVNSDITILGFISGDYHTGIYSVSVKIYGIIKQLLQSVVIVTLPRLSYLYSNSLEKDFYKLIKKIFSFMILLCLPMCIGTIVFADEIVLIISGAEYLRATYSLQILGVALVFSAFATIATTSLLLPQGKENFIFKASIVSSMVNIILNLFLIPFFNSEGAAITTLIAEFLMTIIAIKYSEINLKDFLQKNDIICSLIECCIILIIYIICNIYFQSAILKILICMIFSFVSYLIVLYVLKNEILIEFIKQQLDKFKRNC